MNQAEPQPATAPPAVTVTPADLGKRIVAACIDLILMGVLMVVLGLVFGGTETHSDNGGSGVSVNLTGVSAAMFFVVAFAYYWLLEATSGQTLGKLAMGIKVCGFAGEPIGVGRSLVRNLVRIVDFLPFFYLVGFMAAVFSKNRQRLGDLAATSIVAPAR